MNRPPSRTLHVQVHQLDETSRLGQALGEALFPGAVVALVGPLGAGKTTLTRSIAQGLKVASPEQVTSPTFVLIQEYAGRLPIFHFDAYRLKHLSEFEDLGSHEYFSGEGVCLIEWADRIVPHLPAEHLWLELELTGPQSRRITLTGHGTRYVDILDQIAALMSPKL